MASPRSRGISVIARRIRSRACGTCACAAPDKSCAGTSPDERALTFTMPFCTAMNEVTPPAGMTARTVRKRGAASGQKSTRMRPQLTR